MAFLIQQGLFARQPPGVTRQLAALAHNPVAGHQDQPGIAPDRCPHCTRSLRSTDGLGDLGIGANLAAADACHRLPHLALKRRSQRRAQRHFKRLRLTVQIGLDLVCGLAQQGVIVLRHPVLRARGVRLPFKPDPGQGLPIGGDQESPQRSG